MTLDTAAPKSSWAALLAYGREWLAAIGLTLVLGFGASAGALYIFVELTEEVMAGETLAFDRAVLDALHRWQSPALDLVMSALSAMGSEAVAVILVGVLSWLTYRRWWGTAAALLVVTVGAQLLNSVLKSLFQRTRPAPHAGILPGQSFSFPSGHAMVSAAFYFFLAYLGWRLLRGRWRIGWVAMLAALIGLIGLSRLYLGVHFPSDVLAGYVAGFIWVQSVLLGEQLLHRGRRTAAGDAWSATRTPRSGGRER
jgi:membrane-associated phospholipid phosphatase